MKKKGFILLLVMILSISALAACGSDSAGGKKEDKTLIVATDNSFVPFEYSDKDSGEMKGFDIDLMKAIAKEAGLKIKFKPMKFDGIVPGLKSKRWDMGIAGMSITDERKKSIDFSDPYYESGLIIGVQADNTDIKGSEDLAGKKVSTKTGTTSQDYLKNKIPEAKSVAFPEINQAYQELSAGRVDATLYDMPNLAYYIKTKAKGKIKMVGKKMTAESYGIGFPKGSDLVGKVNKALKTIRDNGTYDKIYKKWFGEKPE
ncbi:amino acid ABC transporter substrate-binding protein (PAAT family) [Scopulibacillus darangshiensis]|uniref:Amino acid ABC transporter substrate-binding protein (PAAT family) n=1 Tax=Scopulibacillus darangshiensis TaxID=442528 RepID=A0A4R2NWK1_9BACL|nr:glutamine ABC transporter substrate-binding protein GlnH [Scopulibacillus darangshiensis]TCP25974.1 amino acid ABC transporter substrate-binding protein (PAAT family) [Scopulibacillus darangshiensis]